MRKAGKDISYAGSHCSCSRRISYKFVTDIDRYVVLDGRVRQVDDVAELDSDIAMNDCSAVIMRSRARDVDDDNRRG